MSKYQDWWDSLDPQTQKYLEKQPLWHDSDLIKAGIVAGIIGFFLGFVVGYQVAFEPVIATFKPLVG